jgi:uncharacterized protein (TIGR02246 family)
MGTFVTSEVKAFAIHIFEIFLALFCCTMKVGQLSLVAAATIVATSSAFVFPNSRPSFVTVQSSSTALNVFGLFGTTTTKAPPKEKNPYVAPPRKITEEQVRALFYKWDAALATGNPRLVAYKYAEDPILLATVSDVPRTDFESIKDYFSTFLKLQPRGKILEGKITIGHNWCKDAGIYEFKMGATGATVKARYSFVYVYEYGDWKIAHHHSSTMPEQVAPPVQLSDEDTRQLFYKWNSALATLDSTTVAQRYAKNAVLLPTVSDVPRTDFESIKDYFDNFLKLKPQGVILESHVTTGDKWCKDVGIYEFTMGSDGSKVKARYSFIYLYEDGEWKISHHHSSAMPESRMTQKIDEAAVRSLFGVWNNALATLDSDAVAMCYAKEAVLLPTVSDTPRTDYNSIKNYFDTFLLRKPQGKIIDSFVTIGEGFAKDVGVYEFTMGDDGSKVKGRYSFVYVFEDGRWKISHHHSSMMPEAILAAGPATKKTEETLKAETVVA